MRRAEKSHFNLGHTEDKQKKEPELTKTILDQTYREVLERFQRLKERNGKRPKNENDDEKDETDFDGNKDGYTYEKVISTRVGGIEKDYVQETLIERSTLFGSGIHTTTERIVKKCDKNGHIDIEMQKFNHMNEHLNIDALNTNPLVQAISDDSDDSPTKYYNTRALEDFGACENANLKNVCMSVPTMRHCQLESDENLNEQTMPLMPRSYYTTIENNQTLPCCPCLCRDCTQDNANPLYSSQVEQQIRKDMSRQRTTQTRQRIDYYLLDENLDDVTAPSYESAIGNLPSEHLENQTQPSNLPITYDKSRTGSYLREQDLENITEPTYYSARNARFGKDVNDTRFAEGIADNLTSTRNYADTFNSEFIDDISAPAYQSFSKSNNHPSEDIITTPHSIDAASQTILNKRRKERSLRRVLFDRKKLLSSTKLPTSNGNENAPGANFSNEQLEDISAPFEQSYKTAANNMISYPSQNIQNITEPSYLSTRDGTQISTNKANRQAPNTTKYVSVANNETPSQVQMHSTYPSEFIDEVTAPSYHSTPKSSFSNEQKSFPNERLENISAPPSFQNATSVRNSPYNQRRQVTADKSQPQSKQTSRNQHVSFGKEARDKPSYPSEHLTDTSAPHFQSFSQADTTESKSYPNEQLNNISTPTFQTLPSVERDENITNESTPGRNIADISPPSFNSLQSSTSRNSNHRTLERYASERVINVTEPTYRSISVTREDIQNITEPTYQSFNATPRTNHGIDPSTNNDGSLTPRENIDQITQPKYQSFNQESVSARENIENITEPTYHSISSSPRTNRGSDAIRYLPHTSAENIENVTEPEYHSIGSPQRNRTQETNERVDRSQQFMNASQRNSDAYATNENLQNITEPTYHSIGSPQRNRTTRENMNTTQGFNQRGDRSQQFINTSRGNFAANATDENLQNITEPTYHSIDTTQRTQQSSNQSQRLVNVSPQNYNATEENLQNITEPTYHSINSTPNSTQATNSRSYSTQQLSNITPPNYHSNLSTSGPRTEEYIEDISEPTYASGQLTELSDTSHYRQRLTRPSRSIYNLQSNNNRSTNPRYQRNMPVENIANISAPTFYSQNSTGASRSILNINNITEPSYHSFDSTASTHRQTRERQQPSNDTSTTSSSQQSTQQSTTTSSTPSSSYPSEQVTNVSTPNYNTPRASIQTQFLPKPSQLLAEIIIPNNFDRDFVGAQEIETISRQPLTNSKTTSPYNLRGRQKSSTSSRNLNPTQIVATSAPVDAISTHSTGSHSSDLLLPSDFDQEIIIEPKLSDQQRRGLKTIVVPTRTTTSSFPRVQLNCTPEILVETDEQEPLCTGQNLKRGNYSDKCKQCIKRCMDKR